MPMVNGSDSKAQEDHKATDDVSLSCVSRRKREAEELVEAVLHFFVFVSEKKT